jgi:hypothetical protein
LDIETHCCRVLRDCANRKEPVDVAQRASGTGRDWKLLPPIKVCESFVYKLKGNELFSNCYIPQNVSFEPHIVRGLNTRSEANAVSASIVNKPSSVPDDEGGVTCDRWIFA